MRRVALPLLLDSLGRRGGQTMTWQARVRSLKRDVVAIALAARDPRVPWYAKAAGACVVAYALSPIDLIPDFVPVLGYLDDLVLVPLGLMLVLRLIPAHVLAEHRAAASAAAGQPRGGIRGDRRLDGGGVPARELALQRFGPLDGPRVRHQLSGEVALYDQHHLRRGS